MKKLFYLFLLISIQVTAQEKATTPTIAVKINLDETVSFDGYNVTFTKMINDSRCPENVDCVWAGEAKIMVYIEEPDGGKIIKSVTIIPAQKTEIIPGVLNVLDLKPYPNGFNLKGKPYSLLVKKQS